MSAFSNQPLCTACWFQREPDRQPVRLKESALHYCAFCGNPTYSGIFIRMRTTEAQFPRAEAVDE